MFLRAPVAAVLTLAVGASLAVAAPTAATAQAPRPSSTHTPAPVPSRALHRVAASTSLRRSDTSVSFDRGATRLDPAAAAIPAARNGTVSVSVEGAVPTVAARVHALGGRVLAAAGSTSTVLIKKSRLSALATQQGVAHVRAPNRVFATADGQSEGVANSNAAAWQTAGTGGNGVSIAIVDLGFVGAHAQVTAGTLPDTTTFVGEGCQDATGASSDEGTDEHGTAVADIVHQMAPAAQLYLYCIADNTGFGASVNDMLTRNKAGADISIASSSLVVPGDSRGDGTGDTNSAAYYTRLARSNGILWIQSAGNQAQDHWSGALTDKDKDNFIDLAGTGEDNETDQVGIAPGDSGEVDLKWDQWPTSSAQLALEVVGLQCDSNACNNPTVFAQPDCDTGAYCNVQSPGTAPYLQTELPVNESKYPQYWSVLVNVGTALPTVRYDLTYFGDVGPAYLASAISPARGSAGSIGEPASSPYVLAVGAADSGADGVPVGTLEPFSSQGPTIDARTKPDIAAWDGVSSPVFGAPSATDSSTGFYGTSAAAPHVAGAAALVEQANPSLDAAQVQNFLEQRASRGTGTAITAAPYNPPNNQFGHGLLTLGDTPTKTPVAAPTGSRYLAQNPVRILDTRTKLGNHMAKLGAGHTVNVAVNVPDGTKAVAINLTGTGATATTYLTAFPSGTTAPNASNLNLSTTDSQAGVFAVIAVNGNKSITIRNNLGNVDVIVDQLGYFGTDSAATDLYTPLSQPTRVLDTRTTTTPVSPGPGRTVTLPSAPPGATAAVVNVTVAYTTGDGYINASPTCSTASSTVNLRSGITRANLAVVKLTSNGSDRSFCVTDVGHRTDVIVDVVGYLGSTGSAYYPLPSTTRIIDTRTGNGLSAGGRSSKALPANYTTAFHGADVGDVPASATALLAGVVEASATTAGYLELFPGTTAPSSPTSNLNFTKGQTVPNAAIVGLSTTHQFGIYNAAGSTNAVVDVFGYFAPADGA